MAPGAPLTPGERPGRAAEGERALRAAALEARVPSMHGVRLALWLGALGLGAGAIWGLDPAPGWTVVRGAAGCELRAGGHAAEARPSCPCSEWSAEQRLLHGLPLTLERADARELALLPGIGPSRARGIVEARRARGGFERVGDLETVPGIGPATLERISPWLALDDAAACGRAPAPLRPSGSSGGSPAP